MTTADKILKLRKEQGLSQEAFSEKLGVSRQSVSKWESGVSVPDTEKILAMSELFGVSTDYLLKDAEEVISENDEIEKEPFAEESEAEYKVKNKIPVRKIIAAVIALAMAVTAIAIPVHYGSYKEAWWEWNGGKIQYPYVLVHGLAGYGDGDGINDTVQYWGAT